MNVYIPRSTITNECTTSNNDVSFRQKKKDSSASEHPLGACEGSMVVLHCCWKACVVQNDTSYDCSFWNRPEWERAHTHTVIRQCPICSAHKPKRLAPLNTLDWFAIEAALLTLQTKINRAFFSNVRTLWLTPPCTGTILMVCRGSGKTASSDLQLRTDICKQWCLPVYSSC